MQRVIVGVKGFGRWRSDVRRRERGHGCKIASKQ
jgi:hypothetical protein